MDKVSFSGIQLHTYAKKQGAERKKTPVSVQKFSQPQIYYDKTYYLNKLGFKGNGVTTLELGDNYEALPINTTTYEKISDYATDEDLKRVARLCQDFYRAPVKGFNGAQVKQYDWMELANIFIDEVIAAHDLSKGGPQRSKLAETVRVRNSELSDDWYSDPWYYLYPQYFGTGEGQDVNARSDFQDMSGMLDYLENLGMRNLYILPFYEHGGGDNGYDVTRFVPDKALAGENQEKYLAFMQEAAERGFRVASDLPFNHVSTDHEWFQRALAGEEKYLDYFIHWDEPYQEATMHTDTETNTAKRSDAHIKVKEPNGEITDVEAIFPDIDSETFWLKKQVNGKDKYFFREFYPFQVDLNLRNPEVLGELFHLVGEEAKQGVLGKRLDAIVHWIKNPGTECRGEPETHTVIELVKTFTKLACPKGIILPEAVHDPEGIDKYFGKPLSIGESERTTTQGDALFNFNLQGNLREMLMLSSSEVFWAKYKDYLKNPEATVWLNLIDHHDEVYNGCLSKEQRPKLLKIMEDRGGIVYKPKNNPEKQGISTGIRIADALRENPTDLAPKPERLALAMFTLYMMPGTPVVYYGMETGAQNNYEHMQQVQLNQYEVFNKLLGKDVVHFDKCQDPRELMRGPISKETFTQKQEEGYLPLKTIQTLNKLRAERPALRSNNIEQITSGESKVLSMVRKSDDGQDRILSLANLSGEELTVNIPFKELQKKLGIEKADAIEKWQAKQGKRNHLSITLAPYAFMLADKDGILL